MATVLEPFRASPWAPARAIRAEAQRVAEVKRAQLRRTPSVWMVDFLRRALFIGTRVVAVPWLLIWPALIGWVRIIAAHGELGTGLSTPLNTTLLAVYGLGALLHSLTVLAHWRHESEVARRLDAYMLHWPANERRHRNPCRRRGDRPSDGP